MADEVFVLRVIDNHGWSANHAVFRTVQAAMRATPCLKWKQDSEDVWSGEMPFLIYEIERHEVRE